MSEEGYNLEIFKNVLTTITDCHKYENCRKILAYKKDPIIIVDPIVQQDFKSPRDIINLRAKMKKNEDKIQRIQDFKKQLRTNTELIITEDIDIDDYKKQWLKLTNNERSNRINQFLKKSDYSDVDKKKLRLLLVGAITNKLLERNSVQYDEDTAEILSIPGLSFNYGTNNYVLL